MLVQEISSFFIFSIIVGLAFVSNFFLHRLDVTPRTVSEGENDPGLFIAERAYRNLKILNDLGPKVVGSDANENQAFQIVYDELNKIRSSSRRSSDITVDHQVASGHNFERAVYKNLQNIVVRVEGQTEHALMLNCHFDSVPGSPGASDDIVMCCVMIELVRILASEQKQRHSIVFLFNGSEEEDLQASHGFITQHRWAKDVRAYINLESTGSGGREILFRSGPKHDWMIKLYRQSVPRPFGHAVAEELFETGVIPSATDFEIFRDDGEVPGLDFAYVEEGWRYHTRYDSIDYITLESVQHTGENILALMGKMAGSDELENPPEGSFAIYFDYLGIFFISYSREVGIGLNIAISILAVAIPFTIETKLKLSNVMLVTVETLVSFVTIIISTILSGGCCYLMAIIMNAADNTMSYFNTTFLSIGIYGSLALLVQIATYHLIQFLRNLIFKQKKSDEKSKSSERHRVNIHMIGISLFWACLTLTITGVGYRFGYITMVLLFVALCTNILTYTLCKVLPKTRTHSWIILHLTGHSFVFLWLCYMLFQVWELFLPITGKQYYANPDILVGLICTLWSVICLSYLVPLTTLIRHRAVLYSMLLTVFMVSLILSFTSVGFPYSDAKSAPRLQRFRVIHAKRSFYDHLGEKTFSDVGFMLSTIDRNSLRTLETSFDKNDLSDWRDDSKCGEAVYCGFPMYRFNTGRYKKAVNEALSVIPTPFTVHQAIRNPDNNAQVIIDFSLDLTTLTMIYIAPGDGWTYHNGSLPSSERVWGEMIFRLSKITYGKKTDELMTERIVLEGASGADPLNVATITIVTLESIFPKNNDYIELMGKFPDYTFAMEQQADVSSYKIAEQI